MRMMRIISWRTYVVCSTALLDQERSPLLLVDTVMHACVNVCEAEADDKQGCSPSLPRSDYVLHSLRGW
jgi:hypothetical protein